MEQDEEIRSRLSPADIHSPDPSSPPVGQTTEVTGDAAVPPLSPPASSSPQITSATGALIPFQASAGLGGNESSGRGGGGGREDCWSEGATEVLIDAWGERFLEMNRGNLRQKHWEEVAEIVSSRDDNGKSRKTGIQCKNRIDTVKKKYKQEKARMAAGGGSSEWIFFETLDRLIGAAAKFPGDGDGGTFQKVPMGIPPSSLSNLYRREAKARPPQQQSGAKRSAAESTRWRIRKRSAWETESESEPELSSDSTDSLPPPLPKRVNIEKTEGGGGKGFGDLARAVSKFCEAYEKVEMAKLEQMAEMEKERMKFMKELELQRTELSLKTQMEILQLKQHKRRRNNGEGEGEGEGIKNTSNDQSGKNNTNVSS